MEENKESSLEKLTDALGSVVTGIPAPLKKNFFKAFAQLCTAAVDIPIAWLEGQAQEKRALNESRVQIIKKGADNIAENIEVPKEYIAKAASKYASKIVKEQLNLDEITLIAAKDLSEKEVIEENQVLPEIEDDWLNEFENLARIKSSQDMKMIFGKILSGEITNPGTFSIRTLRLVSQLDNNVAKLFQQLCAHAISMCWAAKDNIIDARVISLEGNAGANGLADLGLNYLNLTILQEYGLIISDYNSKIDYSHCIPNELFKVTAFLHFDNKYYALVPTDKEKYEKSIHLSGVALTKAAKELLPIIPIIEVPDYITKLNEYFNKKYLKLEKVNIK